ncbi:MAG: glycoside hydrolase family 43 protein [Sedimentisphaerales bacterium]|nr:glycoside hydrolase family 43 protein [Sedimentisphaerales bacterium]
MRRIVLFCLVLVVSTILYGATSDKESSERVLIFSYFVGNGEDGLHLAYSRDGLKFHALKDGKSFLTPTAGGDKLMRDPCICIGSDGLFHMVWTVSWKEKGIGYASSKDLIHWAQQKCIPVMEHEPDARNCWAPEVFYDKAGRQYLIFWATTIPDRFPQTDKSGDGGLNHRMYYVTTQDFKSFSPTRLFYDHGFNVIDSTVVTDGNRYIMFLKDETRYPPQKNIRISLAKKAVGPYGPPSKPITGPYWAEGPAAIKRGDTWYVYFDKYQDHRYGLATSADLKHWSDRSDELSMPQGMRHGTIFEVTTDVLNRLQKVSMDAAKEES